MINTDIFIRRLAVDLHEKLKGQVVQWIYSSSPSELILNFLDFSIVINFISTYTLVRKEDSFSQPGRKWLRQFANLEKQSIVETTFHYGERMIYFHFEHGETLVLLLRGAQGYLYDTSLHARFPFSKQPFKSPELIDHLKLEEYEALSPYPADFLPWYRHKDLKGVWNSDYWRNHGLINPKKELIQLERIWNTGKIKAGISLNTGLPRLEVEGIPFEGEAVNSELETSSALEAITWFSRKFLSLFAFANMRKTLQNSMEKRIKRIEAQMKHLKQELEENKSAFWQHQADLIMGHLHLKPSQEGKLEVVDFFTNQSLQLQVDPEKPAKTASKWYKKARNTRILQEEQLASLIALENAWEETTHSINHLNDLEDLKELKALYKKVQIKESQEKETKYRVYLIGGFRVLVGKQAESNQEILRTAHKDDLWFHARGYSGSHVLIQKAGKQPDQKVIQQAASLAAFFSRGKTAGLCPVQYTARKYVRQVKGLDAGQVVVDREEVLLVEPGLPE